MDTATSVDVLWLLIAAALVMLMQAGFSSLESGLVRSKNSINVAAKNFADFCLTTSVFWLFGYGLMFGASRAGLIGGDEFLFDDPEPWFVAFFLFQAGFAGTATTIMSGAVAERMRFFGYLLAALVMSAAIYPVIGHWIWASGAGGEPGWLENLGFMDFAGSTVVHSVGGWMALAAVLILGPRAGRFGSDSAPHGHDLPVVTLGVFLLWFGWFGFNGGSTFGMTPEVPSIILNTVLAGAAGGVSALAISATRDTQVDVPTTMNGALAGLVGVTASANVVDGPSSIVIGVVAGAIMFGVTQLLERLEIDDVVGAIPVHLGAGVWGTIAVALFGDVGLLREGSRVEQLWSQLVGVGVTALWAFGVGYLLLRLVNRWYPLRIDPEGERIGLNVAEHGASTEILDLLTEMDGQRVANDYSRPVSVEPHTEIGQIASQYNRVLEDINERTAELVLLQEVATAANRTEALEEAFSTAVRMITDLIGWPVGHVYMVSDEDPELLEPTAIWSFDDERRFEPFRRLTESSSFRVGVGMPGRVLARRTSLWFNSPAPAAEYPRAAAAEEAGLSSGFAFPVKAGDEIAAVMEFFAEDNLEPDEELLAVMTAVGELLGRTVERTRSAERRFRTVVDNMPAMVSMLGTDGRVLLVNREFERFYGVPNTEIRGLTVAEMLDRSPVEIESQDQGAGTDAISGPVEREIAAIRHGVERTLTSVRFPVADHSGSTIAIGGIELDITDRKRQEAELAELVRTVSQARDEAMAATEAKSRFLARVTHELRTPLNAIMGFTRLVRRHGDDVLETRDLDNLDKIQVSSTQLLALINDILDISRIEAGRETVHPVEFEMRSLCEEAMQTIEPLEASAGLEFSLVVDGRISSIVTDRDKVRQILVNLLSNAVKFTTEGSVTVEVDGVGEDVELRVRDTGIGIADDHIEAVFDEFHQEDVTPELQHVGTGLGLSIARRLARLLGGDLSASSVLGEGSTFTVRLPQTYRGPHEEAA